MARYKFWKCPDCGGTFKHLHHPDDEPPPDRCALCGAWMSDSEPVFVPQAPAVRNPAIVKAVDDVYYGLEDATKANAERMAAMTPGASAADFSHTVVTNLNDRQKPGDIAWKPPPPSPTSEMMRQGVGGWNIPGNPKIPQGNTLTPAQLAAAAHVGPSPYAGRQAMADLQAHHMRSGGRPPMRTIGSYP